MTDKEIRSRQVAYLLSLGYSQNAICSILGSIHWRVSEPTIANDKAMAESNHWLRHTYVDDDIKVEEDRQKILSLSLDCFSLSQQLIQKSDGIFKKLYVCYSGDQPARDDSASWAPAISRYAIGASIFLRGLLAHPGGCLGVTWGTTISSVIAEVMRQTHREQSVTSLKIAPACGEPLGQNLGKCSSSHIAKTLAGFFGSGTEVYNLRGVFSVIPEELLTEIPAILAFFERVADYKRIFAAGGLVHSMDTLITSVGIVEQQGATFGNDLIMIGGNSEERLRRVALGDIGGVLIPRDEHSPEYLDLIRCWTGIKLESLRSISRSKNGAGVTVLALGENKAGVLLEAIRKGLVTNAICDHHLVKKMGLILGLSLGVCEQSTPQRTDY